MHNREIPLITPVIKLMQLSLASEMITHDNSNNYVVFLSVICRAIKKKYLSYDMIEMMDPSVMFAIPRLAILW